MPFREIHLPCYGIRLRVNPKNPAGGSITSDLRGPKATDDDPAGASYLAAVDTDESLVLAHAAAGIDVTSPAYLEGIETAVDAICNRFE